MKKNPTMKKNLTLRIHDAVILILLAGSIMGFFVFFVIMSGGTFGPLFKRANTLDFNFLVVRRVTSLLTWIIFTGFTIYLGTTEIFPRLRKIKRRKERLPITIIHNNILLTYFVSILYGSYQLAIIFFENTEQLRIMRLLYLADLGIIILGFSLYMLLYLWIPKVQSLKL